MPNSTDFPNPSIPPRVQQHLGTDDPFETWLARQALGGHDRQWLRRNVAAMRRRWESNPTEDLPPPLPSDPGKVPDRYDEL